MFTNPRQVIASFNSGAVGSHLRNWAAKQPLRCPIATSPCSVRASSSSSAFRQNRKTDTEDPSPRGIGWPIGSPTTKTSFDPFPFMSAGSLASPSSSIAPSSASPLSPTLAGGGYLFRLPVGFLADSIGATLGATAAFIIGRTSLKEFINFAEAEVKSLASSYSEVGRKVDALITYFGEDPARCAFEQA